MSKEIIDNIDSRTEMLIGDKINLFASKKIAICGIGGVGSAIPLSLLRSGFKKFVIVDFDVVSNSNLNRQEAYDKHDVGKLKTSCIEEKMRNIRDDFNLLTVNKKIDKDFDFSVFNDVDYVIDCIDSIEGKKLLIEYCIKNNLKIISSLGMGNRVDPSKVFITTLNKTEYDPLAKKLRHELRNDGVDISKIIVAVSKEEPKKGLDTISSMYFVPNFAGILMASFIVVDIIK